MIHQFPISARSSNLAKESPLHNSSKLFILATLLRKRTAVIHIATNADMQLRLNPAQKLSWWPGLLQCLRPSNHGILVVQSADCMASLTKEKCACAISQVWDFAQVYLGRNCDIHFKRLQKPAPLRLPLVFPSSMYDTDRFIVVVIIIYRGGQYWSYLLMGTSRLFHVRMLESGRSTLRSRSSGTRGETRVLFWHRTQTKTLPRMLRPFTSSALQRWTGRWCVVQPYDSRAKRLAQIMHRIRALYPERHKHLYVLPEELSK